MGLIDASISKLSHEIKNNPDTEIIKKLTAERRDFEDRRKQIKRFNRNPDLRHYYFALLSEIEATYIAAQAIKSGRVDISGSKAAGYISTVASLMSS